MSTTSALPLAVLIAMSVAIVAAGAGDPPVTRDAQAGVRDRTLYTSVVDKDGEPVSGLTAEEFIVREDGARREVLRVSRAVEPITIALLVDNSVAASDDIRNIRDGLTTFVREMRQENDIALVALGDRPTILQDYTRNLELLNAGIGRLFPVPASGMTLLDALVEVSRGIERREGTRAVVLPIITDGTEFSNRHYREVIDAVRRSGAALHVVTIGTFAASMDDAVRNRATVLDEGPRGTGGQRVPLLSSMAVEKTLQKLARELSNQYKVVYGRPDSLLQSDAVTVTVTRAGLTARGTLERRTPGA